MFSQQENNPSLTNTTYSLPEQNSITSIKLSDKISIVNQALHKIQLQKNNELNNLEELQKQRKLAENKVKSLKSEIKALNDKICEISIAKEQIEKQIRLKQCYLDFNASVNVNDNSIASMENQISEVNDEIDQKVNDIDLLKNEINMYNDNIREIIPENDELKKEITRINKENIKLETQYENIKKRKKHINIEYIKIKKQIIAQEKLSQDFLEKLERKADIHTYTTNNIY